MASIKPIAEVEELDALLEQSHQRPQVIFKHSVTCGISAGARRRYEGFVDEAVEPGADFTLLEVQNARPLSNAVAERLGVRHHSPQAILVRDGRAVWDASHGRITGEALEEALGSAEGGDEG